MTDYAPNMIACRLFRKKSTHGNDYFTGRWGGCRVALLKSREVAEDGGEIWSLVLSEAPARSDGHRPAEPSGPASPTAGGHTASRAARDWQRPRDTGTARKPAPDVNETVSRRSPGGPDSEIPF